MKTKAFIVILLISFLSLTIFIVHKQKTNSNQQTLLGVIYEISSNNMVLKSSKNIFYTIKLNNSKKFNIGDSIDIKYTGNLDSQKDIQDIKIDNIDILNLSFDEIPITWQDNGIFNKYYQKAYEKLNTLTLDEIIGQLLLVRTPEDNQIETIKNYHVGGYILFGRDIKNETKESLKNKLNKYQQASTIPLLIATDEEGGTVVRVSSNKNIREEKFLSPQEIYANGGYDNIVLITKEMNELLSNLGINVNLAPVADVSTNPEDYIYPRAFGKSAEKTAKYIETVIRTSKDSNVSHVLKHFPGYGNNVDTHTGISLDERDLENFKTNDFLPFASGIENGAEAIMVSHNIIKKVDNNNPSSLSQKIHNLARDELNFTGILITDDLDMEAIKGYQEQPVVSAILAGNDLIIVSDYEEAIKEIKDALNQDILDESIIKQLAFRLLAWKYYKKLL